MAPAVPVPRPAPVPAPAAVLVWLRRRTGRDVLLLAPLCWVAGEAVLPRAPIK